MHHVFKELTSHICNQFLDNIEIKELKTDYEKVKVLLNIQQFMFKHIQNIDKVFSDAEHIEITVIKKKSQ